MIGIWSMCRGEMGLARLPDEGGLNHQSSFVMAAFGTLNTAEADYDGWRKDVRGG